MGSSSDCSASGDLFDIDMIFFLVTIIFTVGKIWMDAFIVAVNCKDWMKKKHLSLTDRILAIQGSIRICYGCVSMLWYTLAKFCPWITQIGYFYRVLMFGLWYFISCNIWLTASLCSCYCVKIADFRHSFFIRLKLRLPGRVTTWLLGSMALSLAGSLPFACSDLEIGSNRNHFQSFRVKNVTRAISTEVHVFILVGFGCSVAFAICATSAALLLFSLWRHCQRMLGSWDGHRSPQTDAHFQAVIIILSLLVNNAVILVSIELLLWSDFQDYSTTNVVALVVLYTCFSVESLISIWGNKKLKNELCRALYFAKCRGRAS